VGVSNVYTQHKPMLNSILESCIKGKGLREDEFPFIIGNSSSKQKSHDIILFYVGGATYAEALVVNEWNNTMSKEGIRIIIGGTTMHNSRSFLSEIAKLRALALTV